MKFTVTGTKNEGGRTVFTVEKTTFFGLIKKTLQVIDSNYIFKNLSDTPAYFSYPNFELIPVLNNMKLYDTLQSYKRKLEFNK